MSRSHSHMLSAFVYHLDRALRLDKDSRAELIEESKAIDRRFLALEERVDVLENRERFLILEERVDVLEARVDDVERSENTSDEENTIDDLRVNVEALEARVDALEDGDDA